MTPEEKLQKDLADARAQIAWLKHREQLLRKQFAFYVMYDQKVELTQENPSL